jgi:hypothetical protein
VRKLIVTVFNYSLDGLLADEGTEFWTFYRLDLVSSGASGSGILELQYRRHG